MNRALAIFFTVALLSVSLSLFAATALADPAPPGGTTGVCNNNPGGLTQNGNNGEHLGFVNNCKAI
jgi:hypothetical protein